MEEQVNTLSTVSDKPNLSRELERLQSNLNQLGEEVERLNAKTNPIREAVPVDPGSLVGVKDDIPATPLTSQVRTMAHQAYQISMNLTRTINEIDL